MMISGFNATWVQTEKEECEKGKDLFFPSSRTNDALSWSVEIAASFSLQIYALQQRLQLVVFNLVFCSPKQAFNSAPRNHISQWIHTQQLVVVYYIISVFLHRVIKNMHQSPVSFVGLCFHARDTNCPISFFITSYLHSWRTHFLMFVSDSQFRLPTSHLNIAWGNRNGPVCWPPSWLPNTKRVNKPSL